MAMSGTFETSWESGTWAGVRRWYHWSGNWARSGDTISLTNQKLWQTFQYACWGSDTDSVRVRQTGGSSDYYTVSWSFSSSTTSNVVGLNNFSGTVTHYASSTQFICDITGEQSSRITLNFSTPPLNLSVTNITPGIDNFSATVSITDWGGEGSASNRYRELQVWTYNASSLTEPRRYQPVYGNTLSSTITANNSSNGSLTITGNTRYTIGAYASNGSLNTSSVRIGDYATLAPKDTLSFSSATSSTATVNYSVPADGGFYTKTLQYSIDNGSTWVTYDTISNGNAKSSSFTISGLDANTQYTLKSRVTTTAGTTNNTDITIQTIGPETPTVSVVDNHFDRIIWQYGTTTFGGGTNPSVKLYVDTSANPTTLVNSKATTGNSQYTTTGLTANTLYRARARAEATFNGQVVYSDYSTVVSRATKCPTPDVTAGAVIDYETLDTVKVRYTVSIPADGGYYSKNIQYRYKINDGSWTSWAVSTTISSGSATNINIDLSSMPVSSDVTIEVRSTTTAGNSGSDTYTVTTSGTHQGPTNFDYTLFDNNTAVSTWLSGFSGYTAPTFIQGKSRVAIEIPEATKGTASDDATLTNYQSRLVVDNTTITLSPQNYPITGLFSAGTPSHRPNDLTYNTIAVNTNVNDSLGATTQVVKDALLLPYENPTLIASGERLNTLGNALIRYEGSYSRLQATPMNDGEDMNSITIEYRILNFNGEVLVDWTPATNYVTEIDENKPFIKNYSGTETITGISYASSTSVEVRITDHFATATAEVPMEIWDANKVIHPAEYTIEVWDWKSNTFIMDVSHIVASNLQIEWILNDVEQISFSLDLLQFEQLCQDVGSTAEEVMKPYARDIRVRRNGEYIVGGQIVEANIQIPNNPPTLINIKCTGFLNLFKDQYILNEAWSGYTYAEIARKLIKAGQSPDSLLMNPTIDIDTSYWLASAGTISYSTSSKEGDGCIMGSRSGTGWITYGSQMTVDSSTPITIDLWVKGQSGVDIYFRERKYITQSADQSTVTSFTADGSWQHIICDYETIFENGYFIIETNRTNSTSNLYADNVYLYTQNDDAALCDLKVALGVDTATPVQSPTRQVNYELQNIKDALMGLTGLEEDNFDFDFSPDRTFNCYERKGSDKLNLEVLYPGNIDSMTITRSATNVANKIYNLGSGIGDERLQVVMANKASRQTYGTREGMITNSNVSLKETLTTQAIGTLYDRKDPTNLPQVVISDGSINPSNVQVGDGLLVTAEGDEFLENINDVYRVMKISLSVSKEAVEQMTLTLQEPVERPEKKTIRYIRDKINGNSANNYNHWVEIEALMLVGNEYVDVAQGKTVYTSFTPSVSGYDNPQVVTDGNITATNRLDHTAGGVAAVTIDLGEEYPIDYIRVWHYYTDNRTYYNSELSVGSTATGGNTSTQALSNVLWSYPAGKGYRESSDGRTSRWLQDDVIEGGTHTKTIRYIKDVMNGSNKNNANNHWVEVEALVKNGDSYTNVALNKTVTATSGSGTNLNKITNGDLTVSEYGYIAAGKGIVIDLGAEYPVDYIRVWHYWDDDRYYKGETLSVGRELTSGETPLENVLWSNPSNEGYIELPTGRKSQWIQGL